jgi:iron(III) transport system ATP-binding protein
MTPQPLIVDGISKAYGARAAVQDASLRLEPGRVTALLGPSGCGKSTLLRLIAGLERPDAGRIQLGDRTLAGPDVFTPPEARGVGLVFQDFALFPHMNLLENVAYGLRGASRAARDARALERLSAVRLAARAQAFPHMLSGGEQQRAALARALAPEPSALLLDEPFSGLDAHLKSEVRTDLLAVLRGTGAAVLVVTHDAAEAMLMADDLVLMTDGRILQSGAPRDCYRDPASPEAARLLGEVSILSAEVSDGVARTAFGAVAAGAFADGPASVVVRPEAVALAADGVEARVLRVAFGGAFQEIDLGVGDERLRIRMSGVGSTVGDVARVRIDPALARVFPLKG